MHLDYYGTPAYATFLAIVCMAAGLAIATGAYRFRRAGMAASALFAAGYYIVDLLFAADDRFLAEATWYYPTYFAAGVAFAAIGLLHTKSGIVVTGFCAGVTLASVILRMADYRGAIGLYDVFLTLGGLVCAPLTVVLKKRGFVAATSVIGANVFRDGVYYFVCKKIVADEEKRETNSSDDQANFDIESYHRLTDKLDSAWWTTTAIFFALAVVAAVVQLRLTARDIDHDDAQHSEQDELSTQYVGTQTPHQNAKAAGAKAAGASNPISLV